MLLEVPGSLNYRALVTRTVAAACRVENERVSKRSGFDEFVNELVSAVGEAFNNIVIHGYAAGGGGTVCVIVAATEDGMGIELRDYGEAFDPSAMILPESLEPSESGMGVFILRAFVDRVDYAAGKPNCLTLFKRYPGTSVAPHDA